MRDFRKEDLGALKAIRPTDKRADNSVVWLLRCKCRQTVERSARSLSQSVRLGQAMSCGCIVYASGPDSPMFRDITGQRFGGLLAVEYSHGAGTGRSFWRFRCDCGNETVARAKDVKRGNTKSCGCAKSSPTPMRSTTKTRGINRGDTFGDLTVTKFAGVENGARYYHCRCVCGGHNKVRGSILVNGQVRSCGCHSTRPRQVKTTEARV